MSVSGSGRSRRQGRLPAADLVALVALALVFVAAYLASDQWPTRTRLLPQITAVLGVGLALLGIVVAATAAWSGRGKVLAEESPLSAEEQKAYQDTPEYMFRHTAKRDWLVAILWLVAFFGAVWVAGITVTTPVFAFAYVRLVGGVGYRAALAYAVVLGGTLYFGLEGLLRVQLP